MDDLIEERSGRNINGIPSPEAESFPRSGMILNEYRGTNIACARWVGRARNTHRTGLWNSQRSEIQGETTLTHLCMSSGCRQEAPGGIYIYIYLSVDRRRYVRRPYVCAKVLP